jgi:glycine dehydrogenase subunit 1
MPGYVPVTEAQKKEMLDYIGAGSIDDLFSDIPAGLRLSKPLDLPVGMPELELAAHMRDLSEKNYPASKYACFLGAGAYDHYIPSAVKHIISKSEFYTAYTPYQPEISQGMLQAIFEYQSMICNLTKMDVSNASMYDGSTALTEAALMACSATGRDSILVPRTVHPEYREVLKTYAHYCGFTVTETGYRPETGRTDLDEIAGKIGANTAAVILQSPNFFGVVEEMEKLGGILEGSGSLFIACVDPISLAMLKPPGEAGADIAVGEGQPLGNPLAYGGPYLGFFAVKSKLLRKMPGRIVGQTTDSEGRTAYVLTIQAREQHIRREKATSNICSNQALNALAAVAYMTVMGPGGLRRAAELCVNKSCYALKKLTETGAFRQVFNAPFFREFAVRCGSKVDDINSKLLEKGIIGGLDLGKYYPELKDCWLVAVTEKRTACEIDKLAEAAGEVCGNG